MPSRRNTVPAPFAYTPSLTWDGSDGIWSTFIVRVGTPSQDFRILPSTQGQETIVPLPEGCTSSDPSNCGSLRGVYPFNGAQSTGFQTNVSSTWVTNGLFVLNLEADLVNPGNGLYGFDTVGLEIDNSGGLTLQHQIVAGIAAKEFYLGVLGLGPEPSNFSTFADPQPSFLTSLKTANMIPSLSYGYTAGATYRLNKVVGSLTLGGYDTSRFTSNNVSFPFSSFDEARLTLAIQEITASDTLNGVESLLPTGILSLVDSSLPYIWLPSDACDLFQQAFQLIYDNNTDLYLVNDTIHSQLAQLNPSITFKLGAQVVGGDFVDIVLPYGAFDLQASYPIYPNATNYFPIRRAANESQYTIGRAFLQEAYLIADYERSNFSVSQAVFEDSYTENIVAITTPSQSTSSLTSSPNNDGTTNSTSSGLSSGVIAGIAVGGIVIVLLLTLGILVCLRRRKLRQQHQPRGGIHELHPGEKYELGYEQSQDAKVGVSYGDVKHEVEDNGLAEVEGSRSPEVEGDSPRIERSELLGSRIANEMESPVVPHHRGIYELAGSR
ncbi:hypothetical protein MMC18_005631 [Xylographa bjoerkii]|nr:hypothetical protein [Xylographa bjoerkii]